MPEIYKGIVRPILDRIHHSEEMHAAARYGLHLAERIPGGLKLVEQFAYERKQFTDPRLYTRVGSVYLDNPTMVGAGWDKKGIAVEALYRLGASAVEVGAVLPYKQYGNKKPRQFMLASGVAVNWLGFNAPGMFDVEKNLARYQDKGIPIGINVGINKEIDKDAPRMYGLVIETLYDKAQFFVLNVSSPNTPGLRERQQKEELNEIVQASKEAMRRKGEEKDLYVKVSPDANNNIIDGVIQVVLDNKLTGIVATNTTNNPEIKGKYGKKWKTEQGGLSGDDKDYRRMATEKVAYIYRATKGAIDIIGVGGVKDTRTALEKIQAGASAVQVVTAIRGEGTTVFVRINQGLVTHMEKEGIDSIRQLRGTTAAKNLWQV